MPEDLEVWQHHLAVGGLIAFHDARLGQPDGVGLEGPTSVVDACVRPADSGWEIVEEVDSPSSFARRGAAMSHAVREATTSPER